MSSDNNQRKKRDFESANYYVLQLDPMASSCQEIAEKVWKSNEIIVESIGINGLLLDHCTVKVPKSVSSSLLRKRELENAHPGIIWSEIQTPVKRLFKRDPLPPPPPPSPPPTNGTIATHPLSKIERVRNALDLKDPGFEKQWHLLNTASPGFDLNVTGVWEQGITGTGVTVGFIDDGIDHENPDLKDNFSLEGSWDYNEHKQLPTPKLDDDTHGTRCAGEVAAVKNGVCGVGVAYTAKAAGIRILSGSLTNEDEALSVTFACNTTQIYSCSWGPRDDGQTMESPPDIVSRAFDAGIQSCRNGLGSIYVFAVGNGGTGDNCNADGYTNSIYTVTVAAMDASHKHPDYSEQCSAILISMYSAHGSGMDGIYTSDWTNGCTDQHGGTSAAAPLAAGVYALLLSLRPELTWRDVQRLSVENAIIVNPTDHDWAANGAGRNYSHKYGYGTFDTYTLIEAAKSYKLVSPQTSITVESKLPAPLSIPHGGDGLSQKLQVVGWADLSRLEHVEVWVKIVHPKRGEVGIKLISPSGFESRLMEPRRWDASKDGFDNWRMMTVAHWDENIVGEWKLIVVDADGPENVGVLESWSLKLWGEQKRDSSPSSSEVRNDKAANEKTPLGSYVHQSGSTLFVILLIFLTILVGVGYLMYTRSGRRYLNRITRKKVRLEKEKEEDEGLEIALQNFDDNEFDELLKELEDPEMGIFSESSEVLFQRPKISEDVV